MWIWGGTAAGLVRLTNFTNGLSFRVDCSKSARNEESSSRGVSNSGLTSADSGLQLNLEIALSGVSAKVKPPTGFSEPAESALRRRMNVTKDDFTSTPDSRIWDFSLMRSETAKTARESAKSPDDQAACACRILFAAYNPDRREIQPSPC